jgi:hypothetical protein
MAREAQRAEVDRNFDVFPRRLAGFLAHHRGAYALMKNGEVIDFFDRRARLMLKVPTFSPTGCFPSRK